MNEQILKDIAEKMKSNTLSAADTVRKAIKEIVDAAAPVWVTGDAKEIFESLWQILNDTQPTMQSATNDAITILNNAYKSMMEAANLADHDFTKATLLDVEPTLTVDVTKIKDYNGGILGTTDDLTSLKELVKTKEAEIETAIKDLAKTIEGLARDFFARIGSNTGNMEEAIQNLYSRLLDGFAKLFHILDSDDSSLTKAIQTCIDKYDEAQQAIASAVAGVSVN